MAVQPGTRLGPYDVVAQIGAGGMGEVYRARDTKLDRDVAIKVLPAPLAADAERIARFEREAKTLAALNHPGIAAIYGFEDGGEVKALVMELVEGPTLADRIAQGPIPVDEALPIARQIAEALEAAHEQGIVHRDLKPANVKVRPDGTVKVLDFGLAKAMEAPGAQAVSQSLSPTITTPAMTQAGVILGTAAYMSPEQAAGKPVDKRADIWAFGCVLYEMLTGRQMFTGETVSHVLAAVLRADPEWDRLPPDTPAGIARLLRRCFDRQPARRLRDIGEARIALEGDSATWDVDARVHEDGRRGAFWRSPIGAGLVGATTVAIVAVVVIATMRSAPGSDTASMGPSRFEIRLGPEDQIIPRQSRPAVSPDGRLIAVSINHGGTSQIVRRSLDTFETRPIPGTEDGSFPFFSPDGEWLGFLVNTDLYKVQIAGGDRSFVAGGMPWFPNPEWRSDGVIVMSGGFGSGLTVVPADGGAITELTTTDIARGHEWPHVLPDGTFLFAAVSGEGPELARYDPSTDDWERLGVQGGGPLSYLSSGHIVFQRDGAMLAVPFDLERGRITGTAEPVLPDVNAAHFAASVSGTAAYVHFPDGSGSTVVQVDRHGQVVGSLVERRELQYRWPRLSPDGRRLAVGITNLGRGSGSRLGASRIWVYELAFGRRIPLQDEGGFNSEPVWSPNGRVVYSSTRSAVSDLYWQPAEGGGQSELLSEEPVNQWPTSFSPDGRLLLFYGEPLGSRSDIYVLSIEDGTSKVAIGGEGQQRFPTFSPDGRWIAYTSDHTGRSEVYVQPYPELNRPIPISTDGGFEPHWSPAGGELFYRSGNRMIAVEVQTEPTLTPGRETVLFTGDFAIDPSGDQSYDVFPDGQSFAMIQTHADPAPQLRVVTGLGDELREEVPAEE